MFGLKFTKEQSKKIDEAVERLHVWDAQDIICKYMINKMRPKFLKAIDIYSYNWSDLKHKVERHLEDIAVEHLKERCIKELTKEISTTDIITMSKVGFQEALKDKFMNMGK